MNRFLLAFDGEQRITKLEEKLEMAKSALLWIQTVNAALDLNKLEPKILVGLIHELRGKAKAALAEIEKGD